MRDLHLLPRLRDSWAYVYVEHCQIDQDAKAIARKDKDGTTPIPVASLALLLLGPGTTITHAAIRVLAEHGCSVIWVGEQAVRCYAQGIGETRSARRLMRQAQLWADPRAHLAVVRRMYQIRFPEPLDSHSRFSRSAGARVCACAKPTQRPVESTASPGVGAPTSAPSGRSPTQ